MASNEVDDLIERVENFDLGSDSQQGKTPISYLQELCTKKSITPQYDLIANEGAVHEPTFVYKVTCGEIVGTGKGPSKKKAKHNAALAVLEKMTAIPNGPEKSLTTNGTSTPQREVSEHEDLLGNPVGELQEFTQKRLMPPPVYEFVCEDGPPHSREFVCFVKLFNIHEKGKGKSKKSAKRQAAYNLLQRVKNGQVQVDQSVREPVDDNDEEHVPLPGDQIRARYEGIKERTTPVLTTDTSQQVALFYQRMKQNSGRALKALQFANLTSQVTPFTDILGEISAEQKFQVIYVDIEERSLSGQCQCLVQLSTMPVAVCHGTGITPEAARNEGAHHCLEYLRIMTK